MKNLFIISESERERILGIHENATKNQYLIKEAEPSEIARGVYSAGYSITGTDEKDLINNIFNIDSLEKFYEVDNLLKKGYGKKGLEGELNDELKPNYGFNDIKYINQIRDHLKKIGVTLTYDRNKNGSIKLTAPAPTQNNPESCPSGQVFDKNINKCVLKTVEITANKQSSNKQKSSQVVNKKVDYTPRINKIQTTLGITNPSGKIDVATVDALINKIKQS